MSEEFVPFSLFKLLKDEFVENKRVVNDNLKLLREDITISKVSNAEISKDIKHLDEKMQDRFNGIETALKELIKTKQEEDSAPKNNLNNIKYLVVAVIITWIVQNIIIKFTK